MCRRRDKEVTCVRGDGARGIDGIEGSYRDGQRSTAAEGWALGESALTRAALLALGQVVLVEHRREFLAKLLLEGLRRVRQALGLELGLALVLGRGLLVADVEVLLDRLAALERLLEAAEGVRALRARRMASMASTASGRML